MTQSPKKSSRREQILHSLATMLEASPGARITTAGLANAVGVSEAALYRHFPSKAKMFEGLIEFIESTLFTRINRILQEEKSTQIRCEKFLLLILTFAERNPGITRLLTGDALSGETERLHKRIALLFEKLETQLKQILREAELRENKSVNLDVAIAANLLMASVEGRLCQFVRSEFKIPPTQQWFDQSRYLLKHLLSK